MSSQAPPSPPGSDDDNLFVSDNGHDGDNEEENNNEIDEEPDPDDDNGSEIGPEVLNEMSESEQEQRPRNRRRARNPNPRPRRCRQCREITLQWHAEVTRLLEASQATERELRADIRRLNERIEILRHGRGIRWDPWGPRLARLLSDIRERDPDLVDTNYGGYESIYIDASKQGIMTPDTNITHPDLYVDRSTYSGAQIREHFKRQMLRDRYNGAFNDLRGVHRHYRDIILPRRYTRLRPLLLLENAPFNFERLPIYIQCRIWKLLVPSGQQVHCLSRLDPKTPPLHCKDEVVRFPNRFHIDDGTVCTIAKADKHSRYLKYLRVCKRWNYATTHLFYGTNTFAFSSLGEFGRFCVGIGRARVERIAHIEIMWRGALTPRQGKGAVSLRKQPLAWLMHASRLRTLVVHINESERCYMRRQYEMAREADYYQDFGCDDYSESDLDTFAMEVRRTGFQPNYRKNRGLRTVQGMDFVYGLRGMRFVRFYDTNDQRARRRIRDWSFSQDVNNVVRRRKDPSMALKAEIENLPCLTALEDFSPDDQLKELVRSFYDETPVRAASVNGSETSSSSSSSGISGVSTFSGDSDDSDDSDDNDDDDDDDDDGDDDDDDGDGSGRFSSRLTQTSHGSQRHGMNRVIELVDSDTEMGDNATLHGGPGNNGSGPPIIDLSDTTSGTVRSARPRSDGLHGTVPPQAPVIVIEDDDNDNDGRGRKGRRARRGGGGGFTTDSSRLFLPSGSCTAHTEYISSSEGEDEQPAEPIDLTVEDGNEEAAPVDLTLEDDNERKSVKSEGSAGPDSDSSGGLASGRRLKRSPSSGGDGGPD